LPAQAATLADAIWLAKSSDMFFSVRTACALAAAATKAKARAENLMMLLMMFSI